MRKAETTGQTHPVKSRPLKVPCGTTIASTGDSSGLQLCRPKSQNTSYNKSRLCTPHNGWENSICRSKQNTHPTDQRTMTQKFLTTNKNQGITRIAPPIWVWSDHRRLSGAWCIVATTLKVNTNTTMVMSNVIQTGLILISTLTCHHSW